MKAVSPIFSAILLFLIAIAVAAIVLAYIARSASGSQSVIASISRSARASIESVLSVVYTGYGRGFGYVALYNIGKAPVPVLAIYVNGTPTNYVYTVCDNGSVSWGTPVVIKPGSLCVLRVYLGPPAHYVITIATRYQSIEVPVYG